DVADRAAVDAMVEKTLEEFGKIDVLVNNAGWDRVAPFLELDVDIWERIIDINLYGPLNCFHAVGAKMVEQGHGTIISISSDAGRVGSSGEGVYSACKGGIIADRKSTRLNSSHVSISYAVFCLNKKTYSS